MEEYVSSDAPDLGKKRQKLLDSAAHYKKVLRKWEEAISKAEGRKPDKNDFKNAPSSVQKAYKEYYKISKYLQGKSSSSNSRLKRGNSKGPSPNKIFCFPRSSPGIGIKGSPSPRNRKSPGHRKSKSPNFKPSRLHSLKTRNIDESTKLEPEHNNNSSFSNFKEKISNIVGVFSSIVEKPHNTIKVIDSESGKEIVRKTLVPNRFSNSGKEVDPSTPNLSQNLKPTTSATDVSSKSIISIPEDESDDISFSSLIPPVDDSKSIMKFNSVSTIWQNFSPNPKSKKNKAKQVNSGWLDRCKSREAQEAEGTQESLEGMDIDTDLFGIDEEQPTSDKLYCESFQNFLLSSKCDNTTESGLDLSSSNGDSLHDVSEKASNSFDQNQSDSGLGLTTFVLSSSDILETAKEILPTSSYENSMDNESLFHSENACPPHENSFQTIDIDAMGDLLSSCSFSNGIIKTDSSESESQKMYNKDTCSDDSNASKKRKISVAFTPSPKKPPYKKFFKTSLEIRNDRNLPKYSIPSFKPLSPVKRKSKVNDLKNKSIIKAKTKSLTPSSSTSFVNSTIASSETKLPLRTTRSSTATNNGNLTNNGIVPVETTNTAEPGTSFAIASTSTKTDFFDEMVQAPSSRVKKFRRRGPETLESKMARGSVNENFVRIDITKKVFVRGKKRISGAKVKRNDWKAKKAFVSKEEKLKSLVCRKCGEAGHFRKFCMKDTIPSDEPEQIDDSPFPSLQEAARMVNTRMTSQTIRVNVYAGSKTSEAANITPNNEEMIQDEIQENCTEVNNDPLLRPNIVTFNSSMKTVEPFFVSGSQVVAQDEEDKIIQETLTKFGYENFRPGQKEAVTRILKGLSTLCVLSTGSGKSLCYQLPAYLYAMKYPGSLAICVSPLVSLMEDQVQGIPPFLQAAFLHASMPSGQREKVMEKIRSKKLHVLLVSPEAVCGGLFGMLRGQDFPQISFACIDEVHCVSQWSHNFRPCYLQLYKILREKLRIDTILGLTATATQYTSNNICENLRMDPSAVIRGEIIPCNLNLSVSRDIYRDEALLTLLRGERFQECDSIIIYCTRRDECQRIAALLRTSIQDVPKFKGITKINHKQKVSNTCEPYHAGMTAGRRRLVQQQFMSGKIRIVVATVAFGMGIDKSDIRSVIHYNMPKNFESYVQEIGRAGRDGLPAHCHLFLDNVKGRDLCELQRHVYSNSIDRPTIRNLVRKVFQSCKCQKIADMSQQNKIIPDGKRCPGHEVSFSVEETVMELDLPQENIVTLLCYLELDPTKRWIEMLPHTYQTCKIHSYGGAALLKSAALRCPPLAAAIAIKKESREFKDADVYLEFNIIEVSSTLGWNSGVVKKELKNLEWSATSTDNQGNGNRFRKSGLLVEFCNLAFHLNAPGDLTDEEADLVLNYLHNHNSQQERSQLYQLNRVYQALLSVSTSSVDSACDDFDEEKSDSLKKFIHRYFSQNTLGVPQDWKPEVADMKNEDGLRRDIRDLLSSVQDAQFTGRSVARILQGIPSPCFPVEMWGRNRAFWRKYVDGDFNFICQIAGQELLRF